MENIAWDTNRVYTTQLQNETQDQGSIYTKLKTQFFEFLTNFNLDGIYIYRDQIVANYRRNFFQLVVEMRHLIGTNNALNEILLNNPTEAIPIFELAVKESLMQSIRQEQKDDLTYDQRSELPDFQVILKSSANQNHIRKLDAINIGKLCTITGIIVSASSLTSKASKLTLRCRGCNDVKHMSVDFGFSGATLPRRCDKVNSNQDGPKCPLDPYQIDHDQSIFINQQTLKLQEAPDLVPVGELPKHILLSADRTLVNQAVPGTRVTVVGIFSTFSATNKGSKHATRVPYLRLTGIFSDTDNLDRSARMFSDEEEQHFRDLAASPDFYEKFSASIAPSIFGNIDMKKAIACLLFGGSKKILPDGMRLRGDINVLMLGDPSTAKSQLLKFAEKVAPISVYTSGKGSSAAGLTASVIRDPSTREFYLEGGAMVLADGGIVCIDEFDKMRDEDRVAIHEAMEQQTISIAKAGITTMLNSRTSVLAAANPIFGRYDDLRSPGENIDFQTTILSRFDLIFIVKDDHNKERDQQIAKHVINVHLNRNTQHAGIEGELDIETMKKYITYAKMTCAPRLSPQAAEKLSSEFVRLRSDVGRLERASEHRSAIPMTVRQLEAIVRITESLAKMILSPVATEAHVDEAIRLFTSSTMDAIRQDEGGNMRQELTEKVEQITNLIRNRIAVGSTVLVNRLFAEFNSQGFTDICIERAIYVLVRQETLQYLNSRKMIRRRAL